MEYIQKMVLALGGAAILLAAALSGAQDLESVVDGVQARYQETHFFQARFQQTSVLATLGEKRESGGRVFVRKPGMMRWEYETPERQFLVSDGVNFWVYTPRQKQVIVSRFGEAFRSKTPLSFLAGTGSIRNEFEVRWRDGPPGGEGEDPAVYRLSLVPKAPHPGLKELRLDVRRDDFLIVRSALVDPFDNITDIRFQEIRVDVDLSLELFRFQIPRGVEVIEPPRAPTAP